MKEILLFFTLLACALYVDLSPIDLDSMHQDTIHVLVKGEVEEEKDVVLKPYATIEQAINDVTLTKDADLDPINPRTIVNDGDVIVIPKKKSEQEIRISINTATLNELVQIPGIGPSTAENILAYRNEHGLFQQLEDLMEIKGIGESKFEKMKGHLTL